MKIKTFLSNLFKETPISYLKENMSPQVWELTERKLFSFNKTVITLSSQALVLSFSVIQIGKVPVNKSLIGWAWTFFLLAILSGVFLFFLKYLRSLSKEITDLNLKEGKYGKKPKDGGLQNKLILSKELNWVYKMQSWMFTISIFQLVIFLSAFIVLMLTAFLSI